MYHVVKCIVPLFVVLLMISVVADAKVFGALGCWRDHPSTKAAFRTGVDVIKDFLDATDAKQPGSLLLLINDIIWPTKDVPEDNMYCFDEEFHGAVQLEDRRTYSVQLEEYRATIKQILNITSRNPRNATLLGRFKNFHVKISGTSSTFFKVHEIEKSSLYFREYSLLLLGSLAEYLNFCRFGSCSPVEMDRWSKTLETTCYILAKFSYWFIKYLPKKLADALVFDSQKLDMGQLGLVNRINGRRLSDYDEKLSKCGANDNNNCNDYSLGALKAARITFRIKAEEYWKDLLYDFRTTLFKGYCTASPCRHDRYQEFFIKAGELIALQYQASNGENNKFCSNNYCSTMWMSTAGYKDYAYYRQCLGDNNLNLDQSLCTDDNWKICNAQGSCDGKSILRNRDFPVALQSAANGKCLDCSTHSAWCKMASCPAYTATTITEQPCPQAETCTGPQFQLHNFRSANEEPLEVLDEVHLGYGAVDGHVRLVSGDIYSGAFLRTQYYMRLEHKFSVTSRKTGITHGPFYCPTKNHWSMMADEEHAVCAQSSFTIFKKISEEEVLSPDVPSNLLTSRLDADNSIDTHNNQEIQRIVGTARQLLEHEIPFK
ncbi:uncharacterized protein LOC129583597 [Paramacrobiotus metropolitanus]|uniref:uncharacterized protein LOC129583597 n=1 Tax=Paramacrobiotus metropolitanus TaxID=2943436 RepID=UPI002445C92C|nr:uncharacterized protein LOC129583597 [Paramacrobiotus metropolitanus]